jgi:CBS domain-containing protein
MPHPRDPVACVMTPNPVTVHPTDPLDHCLKLFERYGFHHLPVVQLNELVGLVSDRDLLLATGWRRASERVGAPTLVSEIQRKDLVTLAPSAEVTHAAAVLLERGIGCLPVVDAEARLTGIVTDTDLLWAYRSFCELASCPKAVRDLMVVGGPSIAPDASLEDALELCLGENVRHLPVLSGKKLIGILSDRDVRRGFARQSTKDAQGEARGRLELGRTRVRELMSHPVLSIGPKDSLSNAIHALGENKIGALPVVEGRVWIGMLSRRDVLRALAALETTAV